MMKTRYVLYSASTNSSRRIFSQCIVILVIIVSYLLFWLSLSDFLSLIVCFKHIKGSKERYIIIRKKHNMRIFGVMPFIKLQNYT